jgi:3-deoxy-manno-octulosonate cytidylyltransferase (CMP-KDO synthetase)
MSKVVAVIPARMGSSRFPGKPLALILGKQMIEHIFQRAKMCSLLDEVYVATCDEEIRIAVENFGGKVLMTSPDHQRASDRVAEAALDLDADIFVMIQGDEPMITLEMIDSAVAPMIRDSGIKCVNLAQRITNRDEFIDRNTIKVVTDLKGQALYFSRSPIPSVEFSANQPIFKQVCIIPFRRDFLQKFSSLEPTPLEIAESIDMLRAIEHGEKVQMVETTTQTHAVDTPEDLILVESLMKNDPLISQYKTEDSE